MTDPAPVPSKEINALVKILQAQTQHHRDLRECIAHQREAIRTAAIDDLTHACRRTQKVTGTMSDLERGRLELITVVTRKIDPQRVEPMKLAEIAAVADEGARTALLEAADALREEIAVVRSESSVVSASASALGRHMAGIRETIHGALSRVGVYERRGRIAVGSQMDCCIDLTT
ncbi:MAG: hypothetical protein GY715_14375 [Planctomycetes bacterium]|nr:hypothetical protein [Planctomycetota bacterium]